MRSLHVKKQTTGYRLQSLDTASQPVLLKRPQICPAHRLNGVASDQGPQRNGTPEYARRRADGKLGPAKRVANCPLPGDGIMVPDIRPKGQVMAAGGCDHHLHHRFADVAAAPTTTLSSTRAS